MTQFGDIGQVPCDSCRQKIDISPLSKEPYWQLTQGFTTKRAQGGPNAIVQPRFFDRYMCQWCIDKLKRGEITYRLEVTEGGVEAFQLSLTDG